MRRLTASSLDLADKCVGPFLLDGVETTGAAADLGTEVHRQSAAWVNDPRGAQEDLIPEEPRVRAACLWLLEQGLPARAEVAYALDPGTGEVRELHTEGRDYGGAPAGWLCGTVDLVAVSIGHACETGVAPCRPPDCRPDEVLVLDWKSGAGAAFVHGPPGEALQLLFGAYCAAVMADGVPGIPMDPTRLPRARVAYAYLTEEGVDLREATIESEAWPAVLERLRRVAMGIEDARLTYLASRSVQVRSGEWCARCPAVLACPLTTQAVRLLREADAEIDLQPAPEIRAELDIVRGVDALVPAQVAQALTAWRHLKRIGDAVETRAKDLARAGLLPRWTLVSRERREIHGGIAHAALRELHGDVVAREGVEVSTTRERLKDALRAHAARIKDAGGEVPRGWLAQQERALLAELEARGGIERKPYEQLIEDGPALPAEGDA